MPSVAMVVSTVGYHWEEVFEAYWAFRDGGANVVVFTVNGAAPVADPRSLQLTGIASLFGLGIARSIAPDTERGQRLSAALAKATAVPAWEGSGLDAVFLAGGHGCLFDVNRNEGLHRFLSAALGQNAPIGAVCHATSTLAFVKVDGESVLKGRRVTGFPHPL